VAWRSTRSGLTRLLPGSTTGLTPGTIGRWHQQRPRDGQPQYHHGDRAYQPTNAPRPCSPVLQHVHDARRADPSPPGPVAATRPATRTKHAKVGPGPAETATQAWAYFRSGVKIAVNRATSVTRSSCAWADTSSLRCLGWPMRPGPQAAGLGLARLKDAPRGGQ